MDIAGIAKHGCSCRTPDPDAQCAADVPPRDVLYAALNNSGLMASIVLAAGSAYVALGSPVPLTSLTGASIGQTSW